MAVDGTRSLNLIAHATHDGLKIEGTREEWLDKDLYLVGRAYDTVHDALYAGIFSDDMRANLAGAAELLGQCVEAIARKRQAVRQKRCEHS